MNVSASAFSPTAASAATASSWALPRTSGTVTCGTPTDTVMVTVLPCGWGASPGPGETAMTAPAGTSALRPSARRTAKPSASRLAVAASGLWPTTSGTFTGARPELTTTVTDWSRRRSVPAGGSKEMTLPCGTVSLKPDAGTSGVGWPASSACTSSSGLPTRSTGTVNRSGPFETTISTSEPRISRPPVGSAEITVPSGTSSLNCSSAKAGSRPASESSSTAVSSGWPTTDGTSVNRPSPSHQPTAPMVTASSSTRATASRARRRRMCGGTPGRIAAERGAIPGRAPETDVVGPGPMPGSIEVPRPRSGPPSTSVLGSPSRPGLLGCRGRDAARFVGRSVSGPPAA
jgi:hypothetical protein